MKESNLAYWVRRAEEEEERAITEDIELRAFHRKCAELYRKRIAAHGSESGDIFKNLNRPAQLNQP